jgi:hypothetical protein
MMYVPSGFGEEARNVKSLQTTDNRRQTTDDGRQVMAIVHMDLCPGELNIYIHVYLVYCLFGIFKLLTNI